MVRSRLLLNPPEQARFRVARGASARANIPFSSPGSFDRASDAARRRLHACATDSTALTRAARSRFVELFTLQTLPDRTTFRREALPDSLRTLAARVCFLPGLLRRVYGPLTRGHLTPALLDMRAQLPIAQLLQTQIDDRDALRRLLRTRATLAREILDALLQPHLGLIELGPRPLEPALRFEHAELGEEVHLSCG